MENVIGQSISDGVSETTAVHLLHDPNNEEDMNGLTFVIKQGDRKITIALCEGETDSGNKLPLGTAYETGGEKFNSLISGRHEQLSFIQNKVNELSDAVFDLFLEKK